MISSPLMSQTHEYWDPSSGGSRPDQALRAVAG
jgi:hypothetical protein